MDQILNLPQAYVGAAEWLSCLVFLYGIKPRRALRYNLILAALWLVLQVSYFGLSEYFSLAMWLPSLAVALGLMLGMLTMLCEVDLKRGLYFTIMAFVLSELASAMANLVWTLHVFLWRVTELVPWRRALTVALVYLAVIGVLFILVRNNRRNRALLNVTWRDLGICGLMAMTVFAASNLWVLGPTMLRLPFQAENNPELVLLRVMTDLGGMAVLYAYHVQRIDSQNREEMGALQSILENQYAQYRMSRETVDLINRKYHDLKHQIAALRAEPDAAARNQWLDEMEADIKAYEAQNKTGSSVLDTLLTSKSLYCQKHQIDLTVVADGKQLSFLSVMDICTIFGNALDNAIECELKIENKLKRMIHLTVTGQKQFLLLQVENYCPEDLEYRGGLPVTTKKDRANHGFGLKSIQQTAKKYGGTTAVGTEDEWFVLKVLIPLPEQEGPQK